MNSKLRLTAIALLGWVGQLAAQAPLPVWGVVDASEFTVRETPFDENATALVLSDYGEVFITRAMDTVFDVHVRMRILTQSGIDHGTVQILFHTKGNMQRFEEVRAQTFHLDENGSIRKFVMDRSVVRTDVVNSETSRLTFALPNVQPGAIIEYSYRLVSKSPTFMPDWEFQGSEPTLRSEFVAYVPHVLMYSRVETGYGKIDFTETRHYNPGDKDDIFYTTHGGSRHSWVSNNNPAVRTEPYMTSLKDVRFAIRFQLKTYISPDTGPREYLSTWETLASEWVDHPDIGRAITLSRENRRVVQSLVEGVTDPLEKAKILYKHVTSSISWNREFRTTKRNALNLVMSHKSGNSAEMTLLLIAMLREAGLEAHPVAISTRSHGRVIWAYPLGHSFNHLLAYVPIGDTEWLLDPISELLPFGMLNDESLNGEGLLIAKRRTSIRIHLIPMHAYSGKTVLMGSLDEEGRFFGTARSQFTGYQALDYRQNVKRNEADFLRSTYLTHLPGVEISRSDIRNRETGDLPLIVSAGFTSATAVETSGELRLLNPFMMHRWANNPFVMPERRFPVNFGYPTEASFQLNFSIPQGYVIESVPESSSFAIGDIAAFQISYATDELGIQVLCVWRIAEPVVSAESYPELVTFFNRLVAAQSEMIVLRKSAEN